MKNSFILRSLCCAVFFACVTPALAVTLPVADRVGAARFLVEAGTAYLQGNDEQVFSLLDEALQKNTYLIDAYLLRALAYRRQGRMEKAREQLSSFLEVQAGDEVAERIQAQTMLEEEAIDRLIFGRFWPDAYLRLQTTLPLAFGLSPWRIPAMEAPHQPVLAFGHLYLSDPPKKKVYVLSPLGENTPQVRRYSLPHSPRAVLPLGNDVFLVLDDKGNLYRGDLASETLALASSGAIPLVAPSDAVPAAVDLLVLADWGERRILLYRPSSGSIEKEWFPPLSKERALFDPLALSAWGPYLAVVDRGNQCLHLLELPSLRLLTTLAVDSPLDVLLLGGPSRAAVLTSTGEVLICDLLQGKTVETLVAEPPSRELWALFGERTSFQALSFDGRKIVRWSPRFNATWPLFLVSGPLSVQNQGDLPVLHLQIEPFGPQAHLISAMAPSISAAWLDKALQPRISPLQERIKEELPLLITEESDLPSDLPSMLVERGTLSSALLLRDLAERRPSGLVLDDNLELREDEARLLLGYCLFRGIPIHLWARQVPTAVQMRLVEGTGGQLLFYEEIKGFVKQEERIINVQIPLQRNLLPEGRLSASLFALYLDAGVFFGRNWLPLWGSARE
ncbi:hypothetical protein [Aminirod propionatiphilus]|uniref:Uncharacterized protein n=1 Tax=Aminirod propionatiphilus TaxID=3415223 RepID=A0ACD1DZB1_9BACT|nr:hypothetical protein KIH16_06905 [Synergistota bacterium]